MGLSRANHRFDGRERSPAHKDRQLAEELLLRVIQ